MAALQPDGLQASIDANVLEMRNRIPGLLKQGNQHLERIEQKIGLK